MTVATLRLASSASLGGVAGDSGGGAVSLAGTINTQTAFKFTVPCRSILTCDLDERPIFTALLADGSALPDWLRFDPYTATFTGKAPAQTSVVRVRVATVGAASQGDSADSINSAAWTPIQLDFADARVKR